MTLNEQDIKTMAMLFVHQLILWYGYEGFVSFGDLECKVCHMSLKGLDINDGPDQKFDIVHQQDCIVGKAAAWLKETAPESSEDFNCALCEHSCEFDEVNLMCSHDSLGFDGKLVADFEAPECLMQEDYVAAPAWCPLRSN